jgi:hypothetical protein
MTEELIFRRNPEAEAYIPESKGGAVGTGLTGRRAVDDGPTYGSMF